MPVSIPDLKRAGVSSGKYKPLFTAPPNKKLPLIRKLEQTLSDRFKDVRNRNMAEYRTYWSIDLLHESPFFQTTQTMVHALLAKRLEPKEMLGELAAYGLREADLFLKVEVPGVGTKLVPNAPLFSQFVIPLTIAYHSVRTAAIFSERDTSPQFKFTPLQATDQKKVACEIWSDIADTMATWYGYAAYKKQSIAQMLKYGLCIAFPMEEWHYEEQMVEGKVVVQKEGLRYLMPHPSRMGYDLYHPAPTINTDTGCEWGLHWDVTRYGDVLDNKRYWNRNSILHSTRDWFSPHISQNYFQEAYPCQLRFPVIDTSSLSRQDKAGFYGTTNRDNAVILGTQFFKLVPRDWGLAEYPYPVWHRFDMANDDTVIWAAPCAYNPMWFLGYDWDSAAGQHSSLSLELSPWQRHLENILTQMYLTAKENLINLIYYDRNLVDKARIDEINNLGENRYRQIQFIDYDSLQLGRGAALDARNAFHQVNFEQRSLAELQAMMGTALNIMERVLQFTAQETGTTAQHYQSAKEIGVTAASSNQRRNLTASGVDDGFEAWGRQIVTGFSAYGNDDVIAQVSSDIKDWEKHVTDLGFRVESRGDRKALVAGKKRKIPLETFARSNIGPSQPNDPQTAQAITQALTVAFQNEQVFAEIGAKRIVKLLEQAVILAGGPRGFDITSEANDQQNVPDAEMMQQLKPLFEQLSQAILEQVQQNLAEPMAKEQAQDKQRLDQLEAISKQLQQVWRANGIDAAKLEMEQAKVQQDMQVKAQTAAAEQQRAAEAHALDIQIKASKAGVDAKVAIEKAQTDAEIARQRAQAESATKQVESATKLHQTEHKLQLDEQAAAVDAATKTVLTDAKAAAIEKTAEANAEAAKITARKKPAPAKKPTS